mgnify:CR=1 FL=1
MSQEKEITCYKCGFHNLVTIDEDTEYFECVNCHTENNIVFMTEEEERQEREHLWKKQEHEAKLKVLEGMKPLEKTETIKQQEKDMAKIILQWSVEVDKLREKRAELEKMLKQYSSLILEYNTKINELNLKIAEQNRLIERWNRRV